MKINNTSVDFEKIAAGDDLDIPYGDNNQVMALATFQNTGKAIAENDIYPTGTNHLLHKTNDGLLRIYVHKESKDKYWFVIDVANVIAETHEKQLQKAKDRFATMTDEQKNTFVDWYDVPLWIIFDLALNHNVHPTLDEKQFEQALWNLYPRLWIDESKAPKRIMT